MNKLNENTKEFLQDELKFIANCYLSYSRRVDYLENETATKEEFIEELLAMQIYIDKIVRALRK